MQGGPGGNAILQFLTNVVEFFAIGVGAILVIMFAVAGFQYLTARDNAQQVESAKKHMFNVILAVLVYAFGLVILQWLVPGGVINL